ncbi:Cobyrinic acid ac-diamide synthase (plasmid) [Allomeiothermus silvanus DSM 9946]|uniref:Cobyrinic acid ac-diamide synthase n=1 Tax=Allomeiothermus silvanus (strain ATCC 700542 / DSM 9946 / NBRC 106475 / NCIMB 13440 / VI-R2) TaxID=526227 RepID=D7BJU6_ALLS1|nr:AAA family ATPase [Allomeiothermus silvanus]ADH65452.1 Cobyrinic acid ac-diamide synthase [Allomeiothermus silvanus DSM 9946]
MPSKWVPAAEYAARTGIPESTLRRQLRNGQIPGRKQGHYWYVIEEVQTPPGGGIFTAFTHAGGAGKTSLVRDLGFELSRRGYRVLLIDADPQANLTSWVGARKVKPQETLLSLLETGQLPAPRTVANGLHLLPASLALARIEVLLTQKPLSTLLLRTALRKEPEYDFVLIDSLPSLGHLAALAAMASDGLIVPVETGLKGLEALVGVLEAASEYRSSLAQIDSVPRSFIRLFVPTKYDSRTRGDHQVLERLAAFNSIAPIASPLTYRPGPHRKATEQALPLQQVGDRDAREEVERLTEEFLRAVCPAPQEMAR